MKRLSFVLLYYVICFHRQLFKFSFDKDYISNGQVKNRVIIVIYGDP